MENITMKRVVNLRRGRLAGKTVRNFTVFGVGSGAVFSFSIRSNRFLIMLSFDTLQHLSIGFVTNYSMLHTGRIFSIRRILFRPSDCYADRGCGIFLM